jgi:hypothetical protein
VGEVREVGKVGVGAVGGGDGSGNIVNMADEEDRRGVGVEFFEVESPTPSPIDGLRDLSSWPAAAPGTGTTSGARGT